MDLESRRQHWRHDPESPGRSGTEVEPKRAGKIICQRAFLSSPRVNILARIILGQHAGSRSCLTVREFCLGVLTSRVHFRVIKLFGYAWRLSKLHLQFTEDTFQALLCVDGALLG